MTSSLSPLNLKVGVKCLGNRDKLANNDACVVLGSLYSPLIIAPNANSITDTFQICRVAAARECLSSSTLEKSPLHSLLY